MSERPVDYGRSRDNIDGDWYKLPLSHPRCARCAKPAVFRVMNSANALVGEFCRACSDIVLKRRRIW